MLLWYYRDGLVSKGVDIMKVQDILTSKGSKVITTTPDTSLHEVSKILAQHRIGAVVVLNDEQHPVGIISERDIVREVANAGANVVSRRVGDVMTTDLIISVPEDEISHLSNVMTEKRIRHLPVMNEDELVGMVSIGDIVKAQLDHFEGEALTLRQYIMGGYA